MSDSAGARNLSQTDGGTPAEVAGAVSFLASE